MEDIQERGEVTIVERINGWWVQEATADGQQRLHGPYPDEQTARDEADLMGGADREIAVELPMGDHLGDPGSAREGSGTASARRDPPGA